MRKEKDFKVGEKEIKIKELNVKEVSDVLEEIAESGKKVMDGEKALSTVDLLFGSECSEVMICRCTGLKAEELQEFSPSELNDLISEVRSLNQFFFDLVGKLVTVESNLQQQESES